MAIQYELHENSLTTDPDDLIARVIPNNTADLELVIERMILHGTTVTKPDILSVLEDFFTAIENMLLEGINVNTPACNFSASIKGLFTDLTDNYDPARHLLRANANAGPRIRDAVKERGTPIKIETTLPKPTPQQFYDMNSESKDSVVTPGGMGKLNGHRMKFEKTDANQGVFFIAADGSENRCDIYGRIKPGEVIFTIPELTAGDYTLEIRSKYNDEDIRAGALENIVLTVA